MTHPTLKAIRDRLDAATPNPWTSERVDHEKDITFEIGPKHDGNYGFRFVLMESNYETEHKNGEFIPNVAKLKGDAELIARCPTDLRLLLEVIEIQGEALEWYSDGLYPGDESEVSPGELRTGRRARDALAAIRLKLEGK